MSGWIDEHPGGNDTFCHELGVRRSRKRRHEHEPLTVHEATDHFKRTVSRSKWKKSMAGMCFGIASRPTVP